MRSGLRMSHSRRPFGGGREATPLLIVSVLLIVHVGIGVATRDFQVAADGREYLQMAGHLIESGRFTYDGENPVVGKPPGFPFLIAVYLRLVGSISGFEYLQLLILFGAYCVVAAAAARMVPPPWPYFLLAFLVATDPLRALAFGLLSEPVFLLLTSLGLYATLRLWETGGKRWGVLGGIVFGLSTYMRPINLFWPILLFGATWLTPRRVWGRALLLLAAHVIVITPWMVRNVLLFKQPVPMVANWGPLYYMTDETLWETYFFDGSGVIRSSAGYQEMTDGEFQFNWRPNRRFFESARARIQDHPGDYLSRCGRQFLFAWTYLPGTKAAWNDARGAFYLGRMVMVAFYAVTVIGILALRRSARCGTILILSYALYTAITLFPVTTESRYLIPAYLWLTPGTLAGCHVLWSARGKPLGTIFGQRIRTEDSSDDT